MLAEAGGALDLRSVQLPGSDPTFCTVWPEAIDIAVPAQLPVDRPPMADQTPGDLGHRQAHLDHSRQAAPLFKREVVVSRFHSDPGYSKCRAWSNNPAVA